MKIIVIGNRRGGAGKTVTAQALGAGLMRRGFSVLSIDLDSQMNLSYDMGAENYRYNSLDILTGIAKAQDAILHTAQGDIIPASQNLAGADIILTETGKEYRLKEALQPLKYDFCILDTPPALGVITTNALTAATGVIMPAQAEIHGLQGITLLYDSIETVKKYCNPDLTIYGILLTRYKGRAILSNDMRENAQALAASLNTIVFNTAIRECIALQEAQAMKTNIFDYAPRSNAAKDYNNFIDEFLQERK